jgi:hypothetical protein
VFTIASNVQWQPRLAENAEVVRRYLVKLLRRGGIRSGEKRNLLSSTLKAIRGKEKFYVVFNPYPVGRAGSHTYWRAAGGRRPS